MNTACKVCDRPLPEGNKVWCSKKCRTTPALVTCAYPGCRHKFVTHRSRARNGNDTHCRRHKHMQHTGRADARAYVYVAVHVPTGAGKVGITSHPKRRRAQLGRGWEFVAVKAYSRRADARAMEADLLGRCTTRGWAQWQKDGAGETFDASVDDAASLGMYLVTDFGTV